MGLIAKFDVSTLIAAIEHAHGSAMSRAAGGLQKVGEQIAETASAMAPRKSGALEDAIVVERSEQRRDSKGRFGAVTVSVHVDPDAEASDYAGIMHDDLTPYGDLKLGKGSEAKDGGRGVVGGGYLERALEAHVDDIEDAVFDEVREALR